MTVRLTSRAAYLEANFPPARREVVEVLMDSGEPMTRLEILFVLRDRFQRPWEYSTVSARVNELIDVEALKETGKCRKNRITGNSANLVGLTAPLKRASTRYGVTV